MLTLGDLLNKSASLHDHLCPRQVLGVRSALYAAELLGLALPQSDKRLVALVETDGCYADGIAVGSGCRLGRRTLRLFDYGKTATTFVDTQSGRALRISPQLDSRDRAVEYATHAESRWQAQLEGYTVMPQERLLRAWEVRLLIDLAAIISKSGLRAICEQCGEEVMNGRELAAQDHVLCRHCAGVYAYYTCE